MQQLVDSRTTILNAKLFRSGPDNAEVWPAYLRSALSLGQPQLHHIATAFLCRSSPGVFRFTQIKTTYSPYSQDGTIILSSLADLGESISYPACSLLKMTLWTFEDTDLWLEAAEGVSSEESLSAAEDDPRLSRPVEVMVGDTFSPKAVTLEQFLEGFYDALREVNRRLETHVQINDNVSCFLVQWRQARLGLNGCLELSDPQWLFKHRTT